MGFVRDKVNYLINKRTLGVGEVHIINWQCIRASLIELKSTDWSIDVLLWPFETTEVYH